MPNSRGQIMKTLANALKQFVIFHAPVVKHPFSKRPLQNSFSLVDVSFLTHYKAGSLNPKNSPPPADQTVCNLATFRWHVCFALVGTPTSPQWALEPVMQRSLQNCSMSFAKHFYEFVTFERYSFLRAGWRVGHQTGTMST